LVSLPLAKTKKQWFLIAFVLFLIFLSNLFYQYAQYSNFKSDEIYVSDAKVLNVYPKRYYEILKLNTPNFTFFTSNKTDIKYKVDEKINLYINTQNINFIDYLKGFYTTSFNVQLIEQNHFTFKQKLSTIVDKQHTNSDISSLFKALFWASPINKDLREQCAIFGVSHLVAISGFHLGILSILIYWILYFPYKAFQSRYFPYRNRKFDILVLTGFILFSYLVFTNVVPSLLRAFVMFIMGIYFLRMNIKILSFSTLSLVVIFIIAFFPKLLFSISLWFSVAGVFYIFLFLQYFKDMNKVLAFLFFNVWIYLAINPITHFFFGTTSLVQLYSPLFTIGFSVFYPVELILHFIGYGGLLDSLIEIWLNLRVLSEAVVTPTWVFVSYVIISLFSIPCPKWFRTLNLSLIAFNLWLYLS